MKCNKCTNIHRDPVSGVTLCLTCGNVIDDCDIAANVEFDNYQNVQGTYVKFDNNLECLILFNLEEIKYIMK